MAKGDTLDELEEIRHDLEKLVRRCRHQGLTLSHPRADQNLAWIAPAHKEHSLRYARPGCITMPGDIEFNEFSSSVIEDVRPAVRDAEQAAELVKVSTRVLFVPTTRARASALPIRMIGFNP